jgi:hypothetical protein
MLKHLNASHMETNLEHFTGFHTRFYKSTSGAESSAWLLNKVNETVAASGALKHGARLLSSVLIKIASTFSCHGCLQPQAPTTTDQELSPFSRLSVSFCNLTRSLRAMLPTQLSFTGTVLKRAGFSDLKLSSLITKRRVVMFELCCSKI